MLISSSDKKNTNRQFPRGFKRNRIPRIPRLRTPSGSHDEDTSRAPAIIRPWLFPEGYALTVSHQELTDLRSALAEFILDRDIPMNAKDKERAASRVRLLFGMDRMMRKAWKAAA